MITTILIIIGLIIHFVFGYFAAQFVIMDGAVLLVRKSTAKVVYILAVLAFLFAGIFLFLFFVWSWLLSLTDPEN